jgi:thiosulfate/3-mercaptopyruvate sulfurtransferase
VKNDRKIVSAEWLNENLTNPNIKIIDCRFTLKDPNFGNEEYLKNHIPNAYYLDLNKDLSSEVQKHGGRHPLPDPNVFARKLEEIGIIKNETMVIAYDDSRFAFSARLWWLLRYLGHEKVALLDGGWNGWLKHNYPTTDIVPESTQSSFVPEIATDWIVDIETVKQRKDLSSVILLDSRQEERYRGEKEPIDLVAGHIPGAINVFWQKITDSEGNLVSLDLQKQIWQNFSDAEEIIVYCGSGVTACVNIFSMTMLGMKNYKLYPGGWSDWCSYFNT